MLAGCSSDPSPTADALECSGESPTTYEELRTQVIASSCSSCHHGKGNGVAPDMTSAANLRDIVSPRYAGDGGTLKIVDPGAPRNSTMVLKVLGGSAKGFAGPNGEHVGGAMPLIGSLSTEQKDAIRHWVCAGANP